MSLCINPDCPRPDHPDNGEASNCQACGTTLVLAGRYRVMRLLSSQTGFGMVYEAYERNLPKILKVLRREHNQTPKVLAMFRHEAEALSRLQHPGVPYVAADGYFTLASPATSTLLHCIVMEKIDGVNLTQWMKQQGHHPIHGQQALDWLIQLAEILQQIHQNNYFHRDIKPENVMIRTSGQLALVDFGAAREVTQTYLAQMNRGGVATAISSAGYTSPEQEQGQAVPQSDFYSLGRTVIYLLTAKAPTDTALYDAMENRFIWRPHAPQISAGLADLLDDMISPRVVDRPANAQAVLTRLQQLSLQGSPQRSVPPASFDRDGTTLGPSLRPNLGPSLGPSLRPNPFEPTGSSGVKTSSSSPQTALQMGIATPSWQILPQTEPQGQRRRWPWGVAAVVGLIVGGGAFAIHQHFIALPTSSPITTKAPVQLQRTLSDHRVSINDLLLFANGLNMVSAGGDKTIRFWDLTSGEVIQTWANQTSYVNTILLSPDDTWLYSGNADGSLQSWSVADGVQQWQQPTAHKGPINTVERTPDGQQLMSGGADGAIHRWEASTGKKLARSLVTEQGSVNSLVVTSDGQYIISGGSDFTIKFWHTATGQLEKTLEGHESFVNALAISPDGQFLFSASADGTIRQWQIKTGDLLHVLSGHTGYVNDMIFSRDGRTLSTGSADKTVRIWNVETGAAEQVLTGFGMLIDHVVISSSEQIVTASRTTPAIKIWQRD